MNTLQDVIDSIVPQPAVLRASQQRPARPMPRQLRSAAVRAADANPDVAAQARQQIAREETLADVMDQISARGAAQAPPMAAVPAPSQRGLYVASQALQQPMEMTGLPSAYRATQQMGRILAEPPANAVTMDYPYADAFNGALGVGSMLAGGAEAALRAPSELPPRRMPAAPEAAPAPESATSVPRFAAQFVVGHNGEGPTYDFIGPRGTPFRVAIEPDGAVSFYRTDARGDMLGGRRGFLQQGDMNAGEARSVFRSVMNAIRADAENNGRTEYRLGGFTPEQKSLYGQIARREAPPPGYQIETEPETQNVYLRRAAQSPVRTTRMPGRASDGSVLPVREPQPFRQSLVGGSGDLADAAAMRGMPGEQSFYHASPTALSGELRPSDMGELGPGVYVARETADQRRALQSMGARDPTITRVTPQGRMLGITQADWEREFDAALGGRTDEASIRAAHQAVQDRIKGQGYVGLYISDATPGSSADQGVIFEGRHARYNAPDLPPRRGPDASLNAGQASDERFVPAYRGRGRHRGEAENGPRAPRVETWTASPDLASDYASGGEGAHVLPGRIDPSEYMHVDAQGRSWNDIPTSAIRDPKVRQAVRDANAAHGRWRYRFDPVTIEDMQRAAQAQGYKGIAVHNVIDRPLGSTTGPTTVYRVFDQSTRKWRFAEQANASLSTRPPTDRLPPRRGPK